MQGVIARYARGSGFESRPDLGLSPPHPMSRLVGVWTFPSRFGEESISAGRNSHRSMVGIDSCMIKRAPGFESYAVPSSVSFIP